MFVENHYQQTSVDFNRNNVMQLTTILKFLEITGNKHSDACGDNIIQHRNDGKTWVFTDWYLKILKYPKYDDKVYAKTWSEPVTALFTCNRDFELYSNDELAVIATTRWAIVDLSNGRPVKIEKDLIEMYKPEDKKTFTETKLPKIAIPENWSFEKEIVQRRTDIDYNDHVHNLTYLDYALDVLPQDIFEKQGFTHLHINYKFQLQPGEKTTAKYGFADGKHIIGIFGDEDVLKALVELG